MWFFLPFFPIFAAKRLLGHVSRVLVLSMVVLYAHVIHPCVPCFLFLLAYHFATPLLAVYSIQTVVPVCLF